ncbi:uncharacterized protein LOC131293271 [Anopheles ziemanni]|uniref:uncharacterized protein LOC131263195 n=1 Tax=Anopheles coustani TaxID=139045 RepID=UPI002659FBDB|nr:uncharacterized protein LOC131263195 [Anopheles coustani]XP_058177335.1 uncharacterized protein LOC131293271 [Anopheles ziemanni]
MLDNSEASEELNGIINQMGGYTMNAADFVSSYENMRRTTRVGGRGRGIIRQNAQDGMAEIRLAAQLNRLQPHAFPIGHLATTDEILARNDPSEITAGIRAMGISGADGALSSATTRRTILDGDDIHIDGNVPVILNGDLFHHQRNSPDESNLPKPVEPYDPNLPLALQFSTITELHRCPQAPVRKKEPKPQPAPSSSRSKTKKIKYRRLRDVELKEQPKPRGRYDRDLPIGPGIANSRSVFGEDGIKFL